MFVFFILLLSRLLYAELFAKAFPSLACSALEVLEVLSAYAHRWFGVDEVYGCSGAAIVDEARSGVYVERCAYNDEDVGLPSTPCRTANPPHWIGRDGPLQPPLIGRIRRDGPPTHGDAKTESTGEMI